ncbi:VOC family protein [Kaistia geumhonensis]|uniref:Catechol 2,3-dioxygenase-like lactoylglutathione lyase family enzyme n=1 Tax=Kaistia geumhonensis TaxID=410839 RepID=A0ABU0M3H9_9HYPH|nr:VOC family protein [Kaistia geumhonensis]MCX5479275.1 VOC family protein [Kaistia geumhonensis]MDQ0515504.1 catechol 2,3-dioxygenase-like lactoylglutathione lyase family enzyme [Kaistia geumhonensis]
MQFHRGRLIDHIQIVSADVAASRRFYDAVLGVLGIPVEGGGEWFYADELFVSGGTPLTGRCHLAFQAADAGTVDAFHAAGLAAGGRDNGGPGERSYHPGYYAAFLLDPDGNNIEAVYHGAHRRSAASVLLDVDD